MNFLRCKFLPQQKRFTKFKFYGKTHFWLYFQNMRLEFSYLHSICRKCSFKKFTGGHFILIYLVSIQSTQNICCDFQKKRMDLMTFCVYQHKPNICQTSWVSLEPQFQYQYSLNLGAYYIGKFSSVFPQVCLIRQTKRSADPYSLSGNRRVSF